MREQSRSKRTIVNPTPAVRKTIYIITRSLIAMTITDINSCAALVCSTERIRRRSRYFRNALRNQYVAKQNLVIFSSGFSLTNSLTTQLYLLQNTATNPKFSYTFLHIGRFYVIIPFFSPFSAIWLKIIYTLLKSLK